MVHAAALNQVYGVLSSNVKSSVGTVLTAADVLTAELAVNQNKEARKAALRAELESKEREQAEAKAAAQAKADATMESIAAEGAKVQAAALEEAKAKAAEEAKARDDEEAKLIAAMEATKQPSENLGYSGYLSSGSKEPLITTVTYVDTKGNVINSYTKGNGSSGGTSSSSGTSSDSGTGSSSAEVESVQTPEIDVERTVGYSSSYSSDGSGTLLGNFKLTFYCPCSICNGRSDGKTANGSMMAEGRTIAVDKSIIPLGSRIYIEGFGEFIAEDTGSAILGERIDICVASHERAYELGVQYGDVYLLS